MLTLGAIFLPSFVVVFGPLPSWDRLRGNATARAALGGDNAFGGWRLVALSG